jgi:hypothetical protein
MNNNSPFISATNEAEIRALKTFDFSPWGGIDGFLKASRAGNSGNTSMLKRLVPDLAHAVDMVSVGVSSLPFEIYDVDTGEIVDSSHEWGNVMGGLDNPQRYMYLLASSLCGGSAYVIPKVTPRLIFSLQYCAPHTITPQIDMSGLQYFDRADDQGNTKKYMPKELLYFWLPDSDVEIGPALNNPLDNCAIDAGIVLAGKLTIRTYGERGYVPITVIGSKGPPPADKGERDKIEGFFDRLLKGGFDVVAKIINSDMLSINRIGAGMDELKQSYLELRRDSKESIADAFGIPPALFMSDNAYASEFDALRLQMYTSSRFVSIYQTIEEVHNEQLFKRYGKAMRFTPESLDIFQEDETKRSASLGSFVSAVTTSPEIARLGMGILGYDLTEEQEAEFDKIIKDKEAAAEAMQEQTKPNQPVDGVPVDNSKKPIEDNTTDDNITNNQNSGKAVSLSADEMKDLTLWYSKARTWFLAGKGMAIDWENKHLSEDVAAPIRLKLANAKTVEDIAEAFRLDGGKDSDIKSLVDVIEKAIEATK